MPELTNYFDAAIWNFIYGVKSSNRAVANLEIALLRNTNAAVRQYKIGQSRLKNYIDGLPSHRLNDYLVAVESFEHCLNAVWKSVELFDRSNCAILRQMHKGVKVYDKGDDSDFERINRLNNVAKHWNAVQAMDGSAPIWITNTGLACSDREISFDELVTNIVCLNEICRLNFVEIPKCARQRDEEKAARNASPSI